MSISSIQVFLVSDKILQLEKPEFHGEVADFETTEGNNTKWVGGSYSTQNLINAYKKEHYYGQRVKEKQRKILNGQSWNTQKTN